MSAAKGEQQEFFPPKTPKEWLAEMRAYLAAVADRAPRWVTHTPRQTW